MNNISGDETETFDHFMKNNTVAPFKFDGSNTNSKKKKLGQGQQKAGKVSRTKKNG